MSMVRKCDVCGQEINYGEYGVKGKAKGLIWGEYRPAQNGKRPCVTYIRDEEDIKLDDVCQDCMEKIMEYVDLIKYLSKLDIEKMDDDILKLCWSNDENEKEKIRSKYKKMFDIDKEVSKC